MSLIRVSRGLVVFLIVVTSMFASRPSGAVSDDAAQQEVRSVMERVRQAALKADTSFFADYLADDMSRIEAFGGMATKEDALHALKAGIVKYKTLEARDMQIRICGDTAIVTLIFDFSGTRDGTACSIRPTVSSISFLGRARTATEAPAVASRWAIARPIPRPPPVTRAEGDMWA